MIKQLFTLLDRRPPYTNEPFFLHLQFYLFIYFFPFFVKIGNRDKVEMKLQRERERERERKLFFLYLDQHFGFE